MRPIPRRCVFPGCRAFTVRSRCSQHEAQLERTVRQRAPYRSIYKTDAWAVLRAQVLREEPTCRSCGRTSTDVDHIVSMRAGGARLERSNCQGLCHSCHSTKTRGEGRR